VNEGALEWRRYQEVAVKGGEVDLKSSAVLALGRWEGAPIPGTGPRVSAALGYRHTRGAWWALGTVSGTRAAYRGVGLDITEGALGLGASAGYRWMEWALVPHLGLSVELTGLRQSFQRDREEDIQDTLGLPALAPRRALGVAAGPVVGLEVPLPGPAFALIQGQLLVRYLPPAGEHVAPLRLAPLATAGAGFRF
jgi:hypothetical protein